MVINCAITRGVRQNAPLPHYLIQFAYSWEKNVHFKFLSLLDEDEFSVMTERVMNDVDERD